MEDNLQEPIQKSFFTQHIKGKYLILSLLLLIVLIVVLLGIVFLLKTEKVVENQTTQAPQITPTESPKISIPCPTVKSFCKEKNEILSEEGSPVSIGGILPKGTPTYAVFDGKINERSVYIQTKGGFEKYVKITLTSNNNDLLAEYYFKSGRIKKSEVKKGEIIFNIDSEEVVSNDKNYNFAFNLIDNQQQSLILVSEINFL